jgi:hypothetical protein
VSTHAKAVYTALGLGAIGTLVVEILGGMFGIVHLGAWQATGVAALCLAMFVVAVGQLDPPKPKA